MAVVMMVVPVLLASAFAALAYLFLDPVRWAAIVPEAITSLSILAAAVLFRLGRGLPQFAVGEVGLDHVRRLTKAYQKVATRLAVILAVTLLAVVSLALTRVGLPGSESELEPWPVGRLLMATSMFFSVLAVVRGVALIASDLDLIRLQGSLIVEDVQLRRAREAEEKIDKAVQARPFKRPEAYGGLASFK